MGTRCVPLLCMISLIAAPAALGARAAIVVVDSQAAYPEGPLWRDGKLLYVEYAGPGVKIWDGKSTGTYWSGAHCGASGLIAYRGDHLLVACYDANAIIELDAKRQDRAHHRHGTAPASHSSGRTISRPTAGAASIFRPPESTTSARPSAVRFCTCRPTERESWKSPTPSTTRTV